MAEEEAVSVTLQDHPNKRKLEDLEPPTSDPDSTLEVDGERKDEEKDEDENGQGEAEEPAKRPRLDEAPDGIASENGHKVEDDTDCAAENAETDANDQFGNNEVANEAPPEGENAAQPVPEDEQKGDAQGDDSESKDVQGDDSEVKGDHVPSSDKEQLENAEKPSRNEVHGLAGEVMEQGNAASAQYHSESGSRTMSRKIEIPNNKVGVLIGKAGDTIKYLQINSGAKIQITRDADADPRAPARPVELVGTLESLNKAERLIKDVIAEADAGGSPSLIARGFSATMTAGSAEIEMPVPSDKVGLIIGKGGETIRSLQTRSGARIQLIPQSSPGDQSKEKKVKVTGDKKQVEMAIELIKEVMNQLPGRPSQFSGNNYNQQGYRPRGPGAPPQWGARGPSAQPMQYDGHQRGPYPSQGHHYPPQAYGNYPPQGPPRSSFGHGWDNRPPAQGPPHGGGYDYYGQGGGHVANAPGSAPQQTNMPGHAGGPPSMAPPSHSQANYNYGQSRGMDYPQPTPYAQTAPPAQGYGHGYGEAKYDNQGPAQQSYGGQGYAPQQGYPPQQQQGYAPQQQYNRPPQPYGVPSQAAPPPQGYAPPAANQPTTDPSYQAPVSAPQPYAQNVQPQQQYPQAAYGSAPMGNEGYAQPQPVAGYPQQGATPAAPYGQQPTGYAQTAAPTAGYGQYPAAAQPGYGDQSSATAAAPNAAAYGYPGQVDPSQAAYAAGQAYSAAPPAAGVQQGYAQTQPVPPQPGYDQSAAAQSGAYATAPAGAPVPYGKTVSPQPGYPPQYDASQVQQMYAAPR